MATVTESYLMGIREGRELLAIIKAGDDPAGDARSALANCIETLKGFSSGPVAEILRGERDFWRNQIKKGLV